MQIPLQKKLSSGYQSRCTIYVEMRQRGEVCLQVLCSLRRWLALDDMVWINWGSGQAAMDLGFKR